MSEKKNQSTKKNTTKKQSTDQNLEETLESGSISVHTENLFPIIKKWLYSEHDIFLRELISNAHDAIKKLERLSDLGDYEQDLTHSLIDIKIDQKNKLLTISDNGLGMTLDEIKKYINQIAFSGAEEFLKKYDQKDSSGEIIGHFGLGFFSAFMVAKKVEIETLSFQKKAVPIKWSCDGTTSFSISQSNRKQVGTDIILHIDEENKQYLEENKIKELVKKYSNFLPIEIQINGSKENEQTGLWQEKAKDISQEKYKEFYQKLFPMEGEPLFHIHLDVDYPFRLKGILYFPKIRTDLDVHTKGRIKLFCNNVFVSDNIPDIIPQYLNLLQGVLDSPDIPLNVSRSFLQVDSNVKKIVSHIIKKIVDRLKEILSEDKETFQKYWEDIHPFVKFGMMSDQEFYDKAKDILIFKKTDGSYASLEEYKKENEKLENKLIYASNLEKQAHFIKKITAEGVSVLLLDSPIDNHFIQQMEMRWMPTRFLRVDSDIPENLLKDESKKDENKDKEDKDKEDKKHEDFFKHFKKSVEKDHLDLKMNLFKEKEIPCILTLNEQMRRFSDMSSLMSKGGDKGGSAPMDHATLVLNSSNPVVEEIETCFKKDKDGTRFKELAQFLYHLALMQQQQLEGEQLNRFVKQTSQLMSLKIKSDQA